MEIAPSPAPHIYELACCVTQSAANSQSVEENTHLSQGVVFLVEVRGDIMPAPSPSVCSPGRTV